MAYEKVESNNWKPENEGDEIEGKLVAVREGTYGPVYDLETKEGIVGVFSTKFLENLMTKVKEGTKVKIVFKGLEAPKLKGHNPMKLFEVFEDKE